MFSIDWTELINFSLLCITILSGVRAYLGQQERTQKREHDQELLKVRLYTDRDIKTAQIESDAYAQGFNMSDDQDIGNQLIQFAAKNPEIVKQLTENLKR